MFKNILKAAFLIAILVFFVSCQEKKDTNKKSYKKVFMKKDLKNYKKPTFPCPERQCPPIEKKCEPCPEEKCEPKPCKPKKKCCVNEDEEISLPNEEQEVLSQDINPDNSLPLEKFRSSYESYNETFDITEAEKNFFELEE